MSWDDFTRGLDRALYRQFDDVPGGGIADPDTYLPGSSPGGETDVPEDPSWDDESIADTFGAEVFAPIGRQFDDEPGGGVIDIIVDRTTSVGPSWLDEATIVVVVLVVLGAGLWLARPLLTIVAGVAE
ncbi:hypothetical protein [Haloplanus salinarum]|uniref:hypothetical protein n=1 Tax=Haloplanus salinarum TaxID=1912324 RepID=UPI00214C61D3|nr:hypothetical protein [Haloplanus salinarum]